MEQNQKVFLANKFISDSKFEDLVQQYKKIKYLPMPKDSYSLRDELKKIWQIIRMIGSGALAGFTIGGIFGFLDILGKTDLSSIRQFIVGRNFLSTLGLSQVRIEILAWGVSGAVLGIIISGLIAFMVHEGLLIQTKRELHELFSKLNQLYQKINRTNKIAAA